VESSPLSTVRHRATSQPHAIEVKVLLALKHQHQGQLKAIVVSNMAASIESFLACAGKWKKTLPPDLLAACEKIEAEGDWENPLYEKIMMEELYPSKSCFQWSPYFCLDTKHTLVNGKVEVCVLCCVSLTQVLIALPVFMA